MIQKGKVYLAGAGPGDPGLLTQRTARLLAEADVVVYDALSNLSLLENCRPDAELISVGKRVGRHSHSQGEINEILVQQAKKGLAVVRLKGGDPFVFGRGGEEMQALKAAAIPYEVIPGVTAGVAVPAYFGIPVSHRGLSTTVTFVTGTTKENREPDLDWQALASLRGTIVFYMATRMAPVISSKLIEAGMPAVTPMCIISRGTLPQQHILKGMIADFTAEYTDYEQLSPGLIVIGEVTRFAEDYAWHSSLPLAGKTVLVTRSLAQSSVLADKLREAGAEVLLFPTICIRPKDDLTELQRAIEHIETYHWLVFTSANGVEIFFDRLHTSGYDSRILHHLRFGAVGKVTAEALRSFGIRADFIPQTHTGEAFARELSARESLSGLRVLIPGSALSGEILPSLLEESGAVCEPIAIYDNLPMDYPEQQLRLLTAHPLDYITFCSSSAVDNFYRLIERYGLQEWISSARTAVIGPVTAKTLAKYDRQIDIEAPEAHMDALVQAIIGNDN
ncbi:hypothetical protein HQ45_05900 [Porphyromonas crevioricanis]|uniref:uroporphyrinogen-III C-methyltransferase n=2 Tax=Porphyromonas crevioricanis TaxID=393921 RepID=A0A0A2FW58_9PORP|nr:uroporphyrinogen-III C-methyltransferase [Porphyromonas crevioricanis]KGN90309.1 hypothetical protein HQ45_05900 [Porphyromonas crevioricanis]KGN95351.1 hypothetical protein HQ38_03435 [Porphyromonas crevioricanis]SJZ59534.1 uroporphyrinogen III methyltransferase / synthase [Porphyromonas crevioricanis]SQH72747.1 Siroheme synthase [Porphyromonas crevioricanis]GAD05612.1 uroporphyrinogen-III methyltransferase/ uroporphyrinogen-III synthase [Porphyromonas crevioricanis JCM 15906]